LGRPVEGDGAQSLTDRFEVNCSTLVFLIIVIPSAAAAVRVGWLLLVVIRILMLSSRPSIRLATFILILAV
jgi:hypothetical protein